jgi:hypothetical protein
MGLLKKLFVEKMISAIVTCYNETVGKVPKLKHLKTLP